jgi:hypothetical protein
MSDLVFGLLIGAGIGYGFRALLSRRRRVATKRRLGLI